MEILHQCEEVANWGDFLQGLSLEMHFLICLMLGLESSLKAKVGGKIFLIVGHFEKYLALI